MGIILKTVCGNCGDTATFRVGNGIRDAELDRVLENYEEDEIEQIRKILAGSNGDSAWSVDRNMAYCAHCSSWKVLPVFYIETPEKAEKQVFFGKCKECGNQAEFCDTELILTRRKKIYCPKCGKMEISVEKCGRWD